MAVFHGYNQIFFFFGFPLLRHQQHTPRRAIPMGLWAFLRVFTFFFFLSPLIGVGAWVSRFWESLHTE